MTRAEIAHSWRRSAHSGLDPSKPRVRIADVERSTRLLRAAAPVIVELAESMAGHPFAVMLADERACIVSAHFGDRTIASQIENRGGVPGRVFNEELTGTSAIGTVLELRRPLAVHGEEHYLDSLKDFSCFGAPILHPITKRFVGLIDVTGFAKGTTPILVPLLGRAAKDVEARLLDLSRASELELFRRYQERTAHRSGPVLALGPDFVLSNRAATDAVDSADYPQLRSLGAARADDGSETVLRLAGGSQVRVRIESCGARRDCVLLEVDPIPSRPHHPPNTLHSGSARRSPPQLRTLIVGEPGSGRTTEAIRLAGAEASRHPAESAFMVGDAAWIRRAAAGLAVGSCIFDDVDALSPPVAGALARLVEDAETDVVLTSGTHAPPSPEHARLLAVMGERAALPPVRDRLDELSELAKGLADSAGISLELAPSALEALRAHDWPGNLHELRTLVTSPSARAASRPLTVHDLPAAYRRTERARHLSRLEKAERDTIVAVLTEADSNIAQTARLLGISRPTLYSRIRALGIAR